MNTVKLVNELEGEKCRCGKKKHSMQTFCGRCYHSLPPKMRQALYNRVGMGYEEAYAAACDYFDGDTAKAS
jgi:hypothetical protein